MTMRSVREDHFDKSDAAYTKACEETRRAYMVWVEACERQRRIGAERLEAWRNLVGADGEKG